MAIEDPHLYSIGILKTNKNPTLFVLNFGDVCIASSQTPASLPPTKQVVFVASAVLGTEVESAGIPSV